MKILVVAPQPFYVERGTPIAVRALIETLCRAGHHVDLLTTHLGADIDEPNLTIHRTRLFGKIRSLPIGFSGSKLALDLAIWLRLLKLAGRGRYDVIHAVEEAVFLALPLRWLGRGKLVYDMDSVISEQLREKWPQIGWLSRAVAACEAVAQRSSDLVLPVCPAIAEAAAGHVSQDKIHLLPDIAPAPAEAESDGEDITSAAGTRPLALYVGNLESYQGMGLLLEALARIDRSDRPFLAVIGGDEAAVAQYRTYAQSLGVAGETGFLGPRPLNRLGHYLEQADLLCSPRMKGVNTPMKLYAYMASGVAIVATRILSHTQVIDEQSAFMADPEPGAYASALREASADLVERGRRGQAAQKLARAQYSRQAFDERLLRAYASLERKPFPRSRSKLPIIR